MDLFFYGKAFVMGIFVRLKLNQSTNSHTIVMEYSLAQLILVTVLQTPTHKPDIVPENRTIRGQVLVRAVEA